MKDIVALTPVNTPVPIRAAVIDDAFDPIVANGVSPDNLAAFHQIVDDDEMLLSFLLQSGVERPDFDINLFDSQHDEYLNRLWELMPENESLRDLGMEYLFGPKVAMIDDLKLICKNLRQCGIEVVELGATTLGNLENFETGEFDLLFIDLYMVEAEDAEAIEASIDYTNQIYGACPVDKRPITILMSSHPNAEGVRDLFRNKAGLAEVSFQFYSKTTLKDRDRTALRVKILKSHLPYVNQINLYIDALSRAASEANEKFQEEVKQLTVDDYALIQNAKLHEEQHPLGDYMSWLYGSRWADLLFENTAFRNKQRGLDNLTAQGILMVHNAPSPHFSRIYASATFDTLAEDLDEHPLYRNSNPDQARRLYLSIGDVFSNADDPIVWIVINPQCDLERVDQISDEMSILLIPGRRTSLSVKSLKDSKVTTDFFMLSGVSYRIFWKVKNTIAVSYGKFADWKQQNGLTRTHRLKLPLALDIQQIFLSSMSRIGIPVSPILPKFVEISIFSKGVANDDGDGHDIFIHENRHANLAFVTHVRQDGKLARKLIFILGFSDILKNSLITVLERTKVRIGELKAHGQAHREESKMELIVKQLLDDFPGAYESLASINLEKIPTVNEPKKLNPAITLLCGSVAPERYFIGTPLGLHIFLDEFE